YVGIASFTILIWDHVDTFTAEVEYIWKGRRGLIVWLFLLNRYLMPLGFIVNLYVKSSERCSRFVRYEGSMTMIGIGVVGLMMFLRIYALYRRQPWIYRAVGLLLLIQAATNAWLLTKGIHPATTRDTVSPSLVACTMIFDPKLCVFAIASASAWLPLLYDTAIFSLTLNRALPSLRQRHASFVMVRLFEDGLIYYSAIFAVTLVLTIMIVVAPPGLKNITAHKQYCFLQGPLNQRLAPQVTMMSRITLNLKKSAGKETGQDMRARIWRSQQEPAEPILFSVPEVYRTGPGMSPIIFGNQSQVSSTVSVASDNTGYELRKNVQR
ncbi:hypothetical protein AMATHDRAFT_136427, partial [Amanita thiersii Skay4041]